MDTDAEIARFKWLLVSGIVFLISGYFSYNELRFFVRGKTAEARVTRTRETQSGGRHSSPVLSVEYQFTEADGTSRSERDQVAIGSAVTANDLITVQYLPGVEDSSRVLGNSRMGAVYLFLACLAWLSFSGYQLWREATDAVHGSGRRKR